MLADELPLLRQRRRHGLGCGAAPDLEFGTAAGAAERPRHEFDRLERACTPLQLEHAGFLAGIQNGIDRHLLFLAIGIDEAEPAQADIVAAGSEDERIDAPAIRAQIDDLPLAAEIDRLLAEQLPISGKRGKLALGRLAHPDLDLRTTCAARSGAIAQIDALDEARTALDLEDLTFLPCEERILEVDLIGLAIAIEDSHAAHPQIVAANAHERGVVAAELEAGRDLGAVARGIELLLAEQLPFLR